MKTFQASSSKDKSADSMFAEPGSNSLSTAKGYEARTTYAIPILQHKENNIGSVAASTTSSVQLSGFSVNKETRHEGRVQQVVQRVQRPVHTSNQNKKGVAVNDDAVLEKEADEMGEKAMAASDCMPEDLPGKPRSTGNVMQRRLPQMGKVEIIELFETRRSLAIELLLHAIDNLSHDDIEKLYSKIGSNTFSMAQLKNFVRGITDSQEFFFKYQLVTDSTSEGKKYRSTLDLPEFQETVPEQDAVLQQMQHLSEELAALIIQLNEGHPGLLKVFGLGKEDTGDIAYVRTVYASVKAQLDNGISSKQLPFVIITESAHNEWAMIGATAPGSNEPITLPQIVVTQFLAGSKVYTGLLVHELSHKASPKTNDETGYSLDSIKLLRPKKRITNAESYAIGYLEVFEGPDEARYYDPSIFNTTESTSEPGLASPQDAAINLISTFLRSLWAKLNDSYKYAKKLYNFIKREGRNIKEFDATQEFHWLQGAVYPHGSAIGSQFDALRALLEDRARKISLQLNSPGYITETLQDLLAGLNSTDLTYIKAKLPEMISVLLQVPFNLSQTQAKSFAAYWLKSLGFIN